MFGFLQPQQKSPEVRLSGFQTSTPQCLVDFGCLGQVNNTDSLISYLTFLNSTCQLHRCHPWFPRSRFHLRTKSIEQWKQTKNWLFRVFRDDILPSYVGIIVNHQDIRIPSLNNQDDPWKVRDFRGSIRSGPFQVKVDFQRSWGRRIPRWIPQDLWLIRALATGRYPKETRVVFYHETFLWCLNWKVFDPFCCCC